MKIVYSDNNIVSEDKPKHFEKEYLKSGMKNQFKS